MMDLFVLLSILILAVVIIANLITLVYFLNQRKKRKQEQNLLKTQLCSQFQEIVNSSYAIQNANLMNGEIKMNILTNDSVGDNELLILKKSKKLLNSDMFDFIFARSEVNWIMENIKSIYCSYDSMIQDIGEIKLEESYKTCYETFLLFSKKVWFY